MPPTPNSTDAGPLSTSMRSTVHGIVGHAGVAALRAAPDAVVDEADRDAAKTAGGDRLARAPTLYVEVTPTARVTDEFTLTSPRSRMSVPDNVVTVAGVSNAVISRRLPAFVGAARLVVNPPVAVATTSTEVSRPPTWSVTSTVCAC